MGVNDWISHFSCVCCFLLMSENMNGINSAVLTMLYFRGSRTSLGKFILKNYLSLTNKNSEGTYYCLCNVIFLITCNFCLGFFLEYQGYMKPVTYLVYIEYHFHIEEILCNRFSLLIHRKLEFEDYVRDFSFYRRNPEAREVVSCLMWNTVHSSGIDSLSIYLLFYNMCLYIASESTTNCGF